MADRVDSLPTRACSPKESPAVMTSRVDHVAHRVGHPDRHGPTVDEVHALAGVALVEDEPTLREPPSTAPCQERARRSAGDNDSRICHSTATPRVEVSDPKGAPYRRSIGWSAETGPGAAAERIAGRRTMT